MAVDAIRPYVELIRSALNGQTSLEKFASNFMALFSAELSVWPRDIYEVLNEVFLDADEYVPSDSESFSELKKQHPRFVIGDEELIHRLKRALSKLEQAT